jgi:hypothetical protein
MARARPRLLDLPVLLGDLLRANNVSPPFMERRPELPPRAGSLNELVFAGRGSDFSLAVEARLPEGSAIKGARRHVCQQAHGASRAKPCRRPPQWPTHIRYEIGCASVRINHCRWPTSISSCSRKLMGQTADKRAFTARQRSEQEALAPHAQARDWLSNRSSSQKRRTPKPSRSACPRRCWPCRACCSSPRRATPLLGGCTAC